MTDEDKLRELMMEMQFLAQQLGQLQQQVEMFQDRINQISVLKQGIDDVKKNDGGDVLLPISDGIFAKGTISNKESLIVNVGADVMVEKTFDETKTMLDERSVDMNTAVDEINKKIEELRNRGKEIEGEMEQAK